MNRLRSPGPGRGEIAGGGRGQVAGGGRGQAQAAAAARSQAAAAARSQAMAAARRQAKWKRRAVGEGVAAFSVRGRTGAVGRAIQIEVGILPLLAALVAQSPAHGRPLTSGERDFLAPIFRDAVDYDAIRIVRGRAFPLQGGRTFMTLGRAIYAPHPVYVDDYAGAAPGRRAILVHEVAHVWQFESGIAVIAGAVRAFLANGGRYARAYRYVLEPGRDLLDYGIEQQASILEHSFLATERDAARFTGVLAHFLADPNYPRRGP